MHKASARVKSRCDFLGFHRAANSSLMSLLGLSSPRNCVRIQELWLCVLLREFRYWAEGVSKWGILYSAIGFVLVQGLELGAANG